MGLDVKLLFDGDRPRIMSGSDLVASVPAVSGVIGTYARDQFEVEHGPISEGSNSFSMSEYFSEARPFGGFEIAFGEWATYIVPLTRGPQTNALGRDGSHIHGGVIRGSAGCIDVGPHEKDLWQILNWMHPGNVDVEPAPDRWIDGYNLWNRPAETLLGTLRYPQVRSRRGMSFHPWEFTRFDFEGMRTPANRIWRNEQCGTTV